MIWLDAREKYHWQIIKIKLNHKFSSFLFSYQSYVYTTQLDLDFFP